MKAIFKHLKENWIRHGVETITVVIGILVAFTLNNWNEASKNRDIEKTYLRDIHEEFKDNKAQFERIIAAHEDSYTQLDLMISMFPISSQNIDSIQRIFQNSAGDASTFNPSQSSLESLMNSASINQISDYRLKKYLISSKDLFEDFQEEEIVNKEFWENQVFPFMIENTSFTSAFKDGSMDLPESQWRKLENYIYLLRSHQATILGENSNQTGERWRVQEAIDSIVFLTAPYLED